MTLPLILPRLRVFPLIHRARAMILDIISPTGSNCLRPSKYSVSARASAARRKRFELPCPRRGCLPPRSLITLAK